MTLIFLFWFRVPNCYLRFCDPCRRKQVVGGHFLARIRPLHVCRVLTEDFCLTAVFMRLGPVFRCEYSYSVPNNLFWGIFYLVRTNSKILLAALCTFPPGFFTCCIQLLFRGDLVLFSSCLSLIGLTGGLKSLVFHSTVFLKREE